MKALNLLDLDVKRIGGNTEVDQSSLSIVEGRNRQSHKCYYGALAYKFRM